MSFIDAYFKHHKFLIIIPTILLLLSAGILVNGYIQNGEWFARSIDLRGGTIITLVMDNPVDITVVEADLAKYGTLNIRELRSVTNYKILIEGDDKLNTEPIISDMKAKYPITGFSVETVGPALSETFWVQTQWGIIIAFLFMGAIVFILFRNFVPSIAVIICAFSDIFTTLAMMQVFGIELSLAGMAAILMLIGYSVDTDILQTIKLLKTGNHSDIVNNLKIAMKTGLTMTMTTIGALTVLLLFNISPVLTEIAAVLLIGLIADVIFTWLQNSVILKIYCERKFGVKN